MKCRRAQRINTSFRVNHQLSVTKIRMFIGPVQNYQSPGQCFSFPITNLSLVQALQLKCGEIQYLKCTGRCHHHHTRVAILRSWEFMKALQSAYARGSVNMRTCTLVNRQAQEHMTWIKAQQFTNMRRLFYLGIFGSCSQCSLSTCCRILAMVRAPM